MSGKLLTALVLLVLAPAVAIGAGESTGPLAPQGAAEPVAAVAPRDVAGVAPLLVAATPADVRAVRRFCRDADTSDLVQLRSMALAADPLVAGNAIAALGRLRAVIEDAQLVELLHDPRQRIRQAVVVALGDSGDPRAVAMLVPALDDRSPELRPLVIRALGRLGAAAPLRELLTDPRGSEPDRIFARTALTEIAARE